MRRKIRRGQPSSSSSTSASGKGHPAFQALVFLLAGVMGIGAFLRTRNLKQSLSAESLLTMSAVESEQQQQRILTNEETSTAGAVTNSVRGASDSAASNNPPPLSQQSAASSVESTTTTTSSTTTTSNNSKFSSLDVQERIEHFRDTALKLTPVTDKIGGGANSEHRYHNMYGQYLLPYATMKPNFKMMEIGLGCNMQYGAGASVALWKELFPEADLWEAEYDGACVEAAKAKGQLEGIHPLVGDQADFPTLDKWIEESGGQFDIIIDDGGHHNCQMSNSFDKLWPQLLPGGIYFIEDLHVGKANPYKSPACGNILMTDRLLQWNEQLMYLTNTFGWKWQHKLPRDILFISCQAEACVIGKKHNEKLNGPYAKQRK